MANTGFRSRRDAVDLRDFIRRERYKATRTDVPVPPENTPGVSKVVRVKNTSGETCPLGGILRIISEAEDPDDAGVWLTTCGKPNDIFQLEYLVNLWDEILDGKIGYASQLKYVDWVLRDSTGTPSPGHAWGPKDAEWKLFKDHPGFISTGGTKTVDGANFVRCWQERPAVIYGEADGDIAEDGTGTVKVRKAMGTDLTTQKIENCKNYSMDIDDEAPVTVAFPNGREHPLVAGLKCPVPA